MDTRAYTHFVGRNIQPISFTSEKFMVTPFSEVYSEQLNIPIFIGATSHRIKLGEVIILIFGQGLWFGNRMEKNLIYPN